MVGGGSDAFIGAVHRRAALMENEIELVCGCFSVNPEISISSGRSYYVPDNRIYTTWEEMFEKEAALPAEERMDFVTIVTPNRFHFGPAMRALELGFNVVIDKPMTLSLEEALKLRDKVRETGLTLALTHVYSGYPAVKEAKKRIARGDIGRVRRVFVEYSQGWLTQRIELKGGNNAVWRNDPKQRAWQEQEEYNPFLKKCWLMMGQAQFYNADFLQASATFSYIARHYAQDEEVVAEAKLWQARCYSVSRNLFFPLLALLWK